MKKILMLVLCTLIYSGHTMAACVTTVIASTPTADFVDNGNGTVTHTKTALMWKRCSEGQLWNGTTCTGTATIYAWFSALQQAKNQNLGGGFATFTDWRAPNIKELASIIEEQCSMPSINAVIFPGTSSFGYWTASHYSTASSFLAWDVNFTSGNGSAGNKGGIAHLRLVRGGQ